MDIKQYIESGIIESYILGTATDQERQEVECMSHIYPEIEKELRDSEKTMEKFAKAIAVTPPTHVKESILAKIANLEQDAPINKTTTSVKENKLPKEEKELGSVIQLNKKLKYSLVASVALLLGIGSILLITTQNNTKLEAQIQEKTNELNDTQISLNEEITNTKNSLSQTIAIQELILNKNTKPIQLGGTDLSPNSSARVFYNTSTNEIVYYNENLPKPSADKQYQLWAIADGTPVDLGMVDKTSSLLKTKVSEQNVHAFAITLEPNGGSKSPTLDQMYVIGNV